MRSTLLARRTCLLLAPLVPFGQAPAKSAATGDPLHRDFLNPPATARPRVWWHWMNGNITKEGIQLDLSWMKRVGIGGLQNFDAALATPQVVEKRLALAGKKPGLSLMIFGQCLNRDETPADKQSRGFPTSRATPTCFGKATSRPASTPSTEKKRPSPDVSFAQFAGTNAAAWR